MMLWNHRSMLRWPRRIKQEIQKEYEPVWSILLISANVIPQDVQGHGQLTISTLHEPNVARNVVGVGCVSWLCRSSRPNSSAQKNCMAAAAFLGFSTCPLGMQLSQLGWWTRPMSHSFECAAEHWEQCCGACSCRIKQSFCLKGTVLWPCCGASVLFVFLYLSPL